MQKQNHKEWQPFLNPNPTIAASSNKQSLSFETQKEQAKTTNTPISKSSSASRNQKHAPQKFFAPAQSALKQSEEKHNNFPTFDCMPYILVAREKMRRSKGLSSQEVYFSDSTDDVIKAIKRIKKEDTESIKIGILFRVGGHTTALFVYKLVPEEKEESEEILIFHFDSTVFDTDDSELLKQSLLKFTPHGQVYSLGYEDKDQSIKLSYKRQRDKYSCATFALVDIEHLLQEDLTEYIRNNSIPVTGKANLFTLRRLPPSFMYTTQSVNGGKGCEVIERKGLKQYVSEHPDDAKKIINMFGSITLKEVFKNENRFVFLQGLLTNTSLNNSVKDALKRFFDDLKDKKLEDKNTTLPFSSHKTTVKTLYAWLHKNNIQNRIIDIYNEFYFDLYQENFALPQEALGCFNINNLTAKRIFDISREQEIEIQSKAILDETKLKTQVQNNQHEVAKQDKEQPKAVLNEDQYKTRREIIINTVFALIILGIAGAQLSRVLPSSIYKEKSDKENNTEKDADIEKDLLAKDGTPYFSDDAMADSFFGRASNTAKTLENRGCIAPLSKTTRYRK